MSIPAPFRRVLEACDPEWKSGDAPRLIVVYGDKRRKFLECFSVEAMDSVERKIAKLPRGSKKRKALQRLYLTQSIETTIDETGRLVLPKALREKIGLESGVMCAGNGDTFEIWNPDTYEEEIYAGLEEDEDFDPDVDPSEYLEGDEED
ncbi:cell division protein MraZ [Pseudoruegeria aquimaris]|uniref:Transcriptional regulator MraZ n=1 Tax=Pseudoruegeria aquimaris TaxID=393663 RepID=A0A1Y5RZ64_9RHOB|nr:cell division/cell wall cluster transcriptional repressor MraZ [Pseudoruegeria aquimaris]SLN26295.1 cell division protein MraZ [Pseudoruegeria aquimaris]